MSPQKARYQVSLKLFLKNAKGEVLALMSLPDSDFAGYYDVPGGRVHEEEFSVPLVDILRREVVEELGEIDFSVSPKPVALGRHAWENPKHADVASRGSSVLYVFFEGTYRGGDIRVSDEHTEHRWLDLSQIDIKEYFKSGLLEGVLSYIGS